MIKYIKNSPSISLLSQSKRRCYVSNLHPCYKSPPTVTNKPAFIRALVNYARENNPARHEAWYTIPRIMLSKKGKVGDEGTKLVRLVSKRMNEHRARAINALMVAMADRLNIITGKIEASVEQLSDWCGLSTGGHNTPKSISRASRALMTLEELGVLTCERAWDAVSHSYIPKMIWVTENFFVIINYEFGKYKAAQQQQLAWLNKGLLTHGEAPITLTEARRRAKEQHIQRAFEYRLRHRTFQQQRRQAQKLLKMEYHQARMEILHKLIKLYTLDELYSMGYQELKRKVDKRYYYLRKLAISTNYST